MDGLHEAAGQVPAEQRVESEPAAARAGFVRDRAHRFPGRRNALKVLYDDVEVASVRSAARLAGLTPTGLRRGRRPDAVRRGGRPGDLG